MNTFNDRLLTMAREMLNCPTAPYREQTVRQFIIDFCFRRDISVWQDEVGNLMAIYGEPYQNTVFAFSAHMDHPGFIAESDSARGRLSAVFYGGGSVVFCGFEGQVLYGKRFRARDCYPGVFQEDR
jgi:putative aminopeptidase FrvX